MDKIAALGKAFVTPASIPPLTASGPGASGPAGGFGTALRTAIESVNAQQQRADGLQQAYQMGRPDVSLEQVMLDMQSASISFQALVQVRNRLVSAYQDIMNMQV